MFQKIFNRGIGVLLLSVLSLILTLQLVSTGKDIFTKQVPNIQDALYQLAPLKITNGEVVEPLNAYREVYLKIFDDENEQGFKIVVDTKADTIDLNKIQNDTASIHLARKNLYFVKKNEISQTNLNGISLNIEKADYQEQIKQAIANYMNILGIIIFVILLIGYLIATLFFSLISFILTIGQEFKPSFAGRMRTSAIAIFVVSCLGMIINITHLYFIIAVVFLTFILIRFILKSWWQPAE